MRSSVTLRFAPRKQGGGRLSAEELHQEADRIMEALLEIQEKEPVRNVATSSDADEGSITVEAIVEAPSVDVAVCQFAMLVRDFHVPLGERRLEVADRPRFEIEECRGTRFADEV